MCLDGEVDSGEGEDIGCREVSRTDAVCRLQSIECNGR